MSHVNLESDLLNYLVSQGYSAGDRLPTISELQHQEHLGLSASKIREQLEVARTMGLVEVRSKTGMRMKDYSFAPAVRLSLFFALANNLHNFELFSELRTHTELAFWHEACALLTPDDIAIMRQCIAEARQKLQDKWIRIPNQEHRLFHMSIFRHLHNPFVLGILEAYWDAYDAIEPNRYADYEYHQKVWDYHERILNEICAENFDAAQQAFEEHTRLLRYEPNLNKP